MRFGMAILLGVGITALLWVGAGPDDRSARTQANEAVSAVDRCEVYGEAVEEMVNARSPEPEPAGGPTSGVIADDGGYTGIPIYSRAPLGKMRWWCDGKRLTVRVWGPWVFEGADFGAALEKLVEDLRGRKLVASRDGIEILLEAELFDASARFDASRGGVFEVSREATQGAAD